MQLPGHIAINYAVWLLVYGNTNEYLVSYLIATAAVDVDHIAPLIKHRGKKITGALWRTRLHELWGIAFFSCIALVLWIINEKLGQVVALGLLLHYSADLLVGETRPFYPYSHQKIQLFFRNSFKHRIVLEILLTILLIIFVIWKIFYI